MAGGNKHPIISYQPLRLLFQSAYAASILFRLPLWTITALIPRLRPHPKWTAKQAIMNHLAYAVVDLYCRIGITAKLSLDQGKEGDRFQVAKPAPSEVYRGVLESDVVKPAPVGGTWFPAAPDSEIASKTVAFHIHGGAFVIGDGRTDYCGFAAKNMLEKTGADAVFSPQYRLSGYAGLNPFPAALQDSLTAYLFLLNELNIPASQVILVGDSAGGNLSIALLRYIQDFGADLKIPTPRCALLLSPWVAPLDYNTKLSPCFKTDYIPTCFLRWGALTCSETLENAESHPYFTPLGHPFSTPVPMFVNAGTVEIFYPVCKRWADEMLGIEGNSVQFHDEEDACHDTFLMGKVIGFDESAENVTAAAGAFVSNV